MARYIERRAGPRVSYKSPVMIKNLKSGAFSNARIVNFCDDGLCFESNSIHDIGSEVILGIGNSPYTNGSNAIDVYRARVLWRKQVKSTFYDYGYGVHLIAASNDNMPFNQPDSGKLPGQK